MMQTPITTLQINKFYQQKRYLKEYQFRNYEYSMI